MVREIYSLRETLTKNFEANSTNVTESNEQTNKHMNGGTERRKLYTHRHKCRRYKKIIKGEITQKVRKHELSFLYATYRHDLFYITVKYHQNILNGIQVIEWTRKCLRRNGQRMDGQTTDDARLSAISIEISRNSAFFRLRYAYNAIFFCS